jgi:UDPglucose 6-dehydrogenase
MGSDKRIGTAFLYPGVGYGGSCFPKDVQAIITQAKNDLDYDTDVLESVMKFNDKQPLLLVELVEKKLGDLKGKTAAVLGLAFKAGTDDMRESRAIPVVNKLLELGVKVQAYDPKASENAKEFFKDKIDYTTSIPDALKDADFCMIVTEWDEFKNVDFSPMKEKKVFDGRNILENRKDVDYEGLCW